MTFYFLSAYDLRSDTTTSRYLRKKYNMFICFGLGLNSLCFATEASSVHTLRYDRFRYDKKQRSEVTLLHATLPYP